MITASLLQVLKERLTRLDYGGISYNVTASIIEQDLTTCIHLFVPNIIYVLLSICTSFRSKCPKMSKRQNEIHHRLCFGSLNGQTLLMLR